MSMLVKSAIAFALLLVASIVFTRLYLSNGENHAGTYYPPQPYSGSLPAEPLADDQHPEIPSEPGAPSEPDEAAKPEPVAVAAMDETEIAQDKQFQQLLPEAFDSGGRIRIYSFLDSPHAKINLFADKKLSGTDAELLRPLLRTTFVETKSKREKQRAYQTLRRFIKYQLEGEPWQYAFDEWPGQHIAVLEVIEDILHDVIKDQASFPDRDDLDTAREVALTQFERDPRWSLPARVSVEIMAITSGLKSEENYSAACSILIDSESLERCWIFVSNLRKHI